MKQGVIMEGYFYHGIETYYGTYGHSIELMLKILKEGIKTRKEVQTNSFARYAGALGASLLAAQKSNIKLQV